MLRIRIDRMCASGKVLINVGYRLVILARMIVRCFMLQGDTVDKEINY